MSKNRRGKKSGLLLEVLALSFAAFLLSFVMNAAFEGISHGISLGVGIPLTLSVVGLGVISDGLGVASARAKEGPLLSMASRRIIGAREALWFVRNAAKVSSVCNDVLGDVAATISGALAVAVSFSVQAAYPDISWLLATSAAVGVASALSVGGKALFKPVALKYAESMILFLGRARYYVNRAFRRTKNSDDR
jgi:hypothetical protein